MEQNFESILTSLLEAYEKNNNQEVDALIEKSCETQDLSEAGKALLKETNEYIDAFTEKAVSLAKTREDGATRKRWMLQEIDAITEGRSEKEKAAVVSAISESNEATIQGMLNQE